MKTIRLSREWRVGRELTKGGFGRIHEGKSDSGDEVVIKLIPKAPGADRELLFESLTGVPNVIPILDSGEWNDFWVLVMPRAATSLRERLTESGGSLPVDEAMNVLLDITTALGALEDDVVHRDLKPENVLLYKGHWCLADFGIARYAEATTATETWKYAKTWAYAAPEQWRGQRATSATDVYATGIIAYEMITGEIPFAGPEEYVFRKQHLEADAPPAPNCPAPVASIISECLFKAPQARPTPENIQARLRSAQSPASESAKRLQQANQAVVERKAAESAAASAAQSEAQRREELLQVARCALEQMESALRAQVVGAAPQSDGPDNWPLSLNGAELSIAPIKKAPPMPFGDDRYAPPFDVIAYSTISVRIPPDRWQYEGRSHSLWFCDAQDEGVFRWYETAFMYSGLVGKRGRQDPFALDPGENAGVALSPVMDVIQAAWPFSAIDQGQEDDFIERWMRWFADGAEAKLQHPSRMPERDPIGSWRRG